ncbi:hypothetical protein HID58_014842, partial [Brassica napus]
FLYKSTPKQNKAVVHFNCKSITTYFPKKPQNGDHKLLLIGTVVMEKLREKGVEVQEEKLGCGRASRAEGVEVSRESGGEQGKWSWERRTAVTLLFFCQILLAILLRPLGVFLRYGCRVEFWICLVLTLLGYLHGILYALYVLTK